MTTAIYIITDDHDKIITMIMVTMTVMTNNYMGKKSTQTSRFLLTALKISVGDAVEANNAVS